MNSTGRQPRIKGEQALASVFTPRHALLQRKCDCGNHTIAGGECEDCQRERGATTLRRGATSATALNDAPPIVQEALRSPGQPFAPTTHAFQEPRFNHDFSRVRAQSDQRAAEPVQARQSGRLFKANVETTFAPPADKTPAPALETEETPGKKDANCCACVESLAIQNASSTKDGGSFGHKFDLVAGLEYKNTEKKGFHDAILKWEERLSRISPQHQEKFKMKPYVWYDGFDLFPDSSTFDGWTKNRTKPCPGKEPATITDEPSISVNMGARTLQFKLTVKSALGCDCPIKSLTVTAKQVLAPDGEGGIKTQSFEIPSD